MPERLTPEQLDDTRTRLLKNAEDWARWYPHLASSADLAAVLRAAARDARTLARVRAWTESDTPVFFVLQIKPHDIINACKSDVAALLRDEDQ